MTYKDGSFEVMIPHIHSIHALIDELEKKINDLRHHYATKTKHTELSAKFFMFEINRINKELRRLIPGEVHEGWG